MGRAPQTLDMRRPRIFFAPTFCNSTDMAYAREAHPRLLTTRRNPGNGYRDAPHPARNTMTGQSGLTLVRYPCSRQRPHVRQLTTWLTPEPLPGSGLGVIADLIGHWAGFQTEPPFAWNVCHPGHDLGGAPRLPVGRRFPDAPLESHRPGVAPGAFTSSHPPASLAS